MENCGREDGLQYKKHIMPERSIVAVSQFNVAANEVRRYKRYKEYAVIKKNNLQEN